MKSIAKKILTVSLLSAIVLSILPFSGCAVSAPEREAKVAGKFTYRQLGADTMPIAGFLAPPPADPFPGSSWSKECPNYITEEQYQLLEDSGLNVIYGLKEDYRTFSDSTLEALDLAEKHNIVYVLTDSTSFDVRTGKIPDQKTFDLQTAAYRDHPAFGGIHLVDEPSAALFDSVAKMAELCDGLGINYYVNMLPTYASATQLSGTDDFYTYDDYMSQYMEKVAPPYISYDFYPCMDRFPTMRAGYYNNMRLIRQYAQESNVPFWTFIQCGGPWEQNSTVRYPTKAEFLWQVNTGLAMGAKGIQYFPYFFPPEWKQPGHEDAVAGLIGRDGLPSPLYTYAQEMNAQIAAIDEVLMNSYNEGILLEGMGCTPMDPGQGEEKILLDEYYELKSVAVDDVDCIVGCFNYAGKSAFYVVNNTIEERGPVTLNFDKKYKMRVVQNAESKDVSEKDLTLQMSPGEGVLVVMS